MLNRRSFVGAGIGAASSLAGPFSWGRSQELTDLEIRDALAALRKRRVSPIELTRACLERIERLEPSINAFITVTAEQALDRARLLETQRMRGRARGLLHGIPVALKDNIDTAGVRTTAAAAAFDKRVPAEDAEVTRRLLDAGAVILGKLNMDECAYGVTSTTGHFGAVRNPWARDFIAGGSSGGPGAAVAAGLCLGALGTDTGGSIRQPAAFCGITGLKPTYGLVSTRGVVPLSWSLDHVGPLARSAADTALLLQVIAGYDPADASSAEFTLPDYSAALNRSTRKLRIGLPRRPFFDGLDPDVAQTIDTAIKILTDMTSRITEVTLPAVPNLALMFVEANSYYSTKIQQAPDGFSAATRSLVEMGSKIDAADYAEAQRKLIMIRRQALAVFRDVDLVVTPTTPNLPDTIAASRQPIAQRGPPLSARNTTPFNIYGWPTISIPCGFSGNGLPIGLQVSGPLCADASVLALAHAFQQRTDWHLRRPNLPAP